MNERDAYRAWNGEQHRLAKWRKALHEIDLGIESLQLDMEAACHHSVFKMLTGNQRYRRTVKDFLLMRGCSKNMEGWRRACGSDVGLFKKTRRLGWDRLWAVLLEVYREGT